MECKDYIKRDETGGRLMKFNINQPMLTYTATVARNVRVEDTNFEYDRQHTRWHAGVKELNIKPSLKPNFISLSRHSKRRSSLKKNAVQSSSP